METTASARQVKGEIYDALRTALTKPKSSKSKTTWSEAFVNEMLKQAITNPNSPMAQLVAKSILKDDILTELDANTEKLLSRDRDFLEYRILKQLYKEQADVLANESDKRILVNTSRRWGKTEFAARWLVKKCVAPNSYCLYVHLTFSNAIHQMFDKIVDCAEKIELGIDHKSKSEGVIAFINGSCITLRGNSNKAEADKNRGFKYNGIVIEEGAYAINLKYLIEDVLTPTMADFKNSQMLMISTPPRAPKTYYEECYRSGTWKVYNGKATDNPFIDFGSFVKETLETKGLTEDSPFVQRELFGQFAYDTEAQVFKNYLTYSSNDEQPIQVARRLGINPTNIYIGADWGYEDYNAIVGVAYDVKAKKGLVFAERKFNHAAVSDIVRVVREVFEQGKQILIQNNLPLDNIGIYGDTNEKSVIYELSQTHGLPAYCAYKYDKANALSQLAEYTRTTLYVPENGVLADEFERTLYKRDDQDVILPEIDDTIYHPDAIMALLYASRQWHWDIGGAVEEI